MLYFLYRIGYFLAKVLPLKASYAIAESVAKLFYIFAKKDKEELGANLRMVLGEQSDDEIINEHILAVFKNFAKYLADFFRFPVFTEDYIAKNIKIEGRENLDKCLSEGKGVIVVSLHLGNWELGGAVTGGLNYPITAIALKHTNKRINDFFVKQRAINNLRSIPIGFQIKECFNVIKRNEILAIVGDKDYTARGIYVDFFGKKALMPKGSAAFSIKTGAPIVFCVLIREKDDTFRLVFGEPIKYTPTGDYDKDVEAVMKEYIGIFEYYIRENPDQWYAFKKIWDPTKKIQ